MKDKWGTFDEFELYQRKAMLNWKKFLVRVREACGVYSHSLLGSSHPRWWHLVKAGTVWPWAMPRGMGQALLSKCPAYTQPALPEPRTECAVSKRDVTNSYILLITRAGTNSFLYKKVDGTITHLFSLFSKIISVSNHHDTFIGVKNCTST